MIKLITPFAIAVPWIFDAEGGFVNAKEDRGGATKFGISLRYLQLAPDSDRDGYRDGDLNHDGKVDLADIRWLTEEQAIEIYERDFWTAARCGEMPMHVALPLFDARVNHRPKTAVMLVQQSLRVAADGIVGPATIRAACASTAEDFLPDYFSRRALLFADIARADTSQTKFERGWFRRLFLLQAYVLAAHFVRRGVA